MTEQTRKEKHERIIQAATCMIEAGTSHTAGAGEFCTAVFTVLRSIYLRGAAECPESVDTAREVLRRQMRGLESLLCCGPDELRAYNSVLEQHGSVVEEIGAG